MTALTLFEIASEYRQIADVLQDANCDEQTLMDTLEGERWPLELKAQNYGFVIGNLEASIAAITQAVKQMEARADSMKRRAEYLRERLKTGMEIAGVTKLECPHFAISIQKNPPAVEVWDERQVPEEFWVQPPPPAKKISKDALKAALKAGEDVPGAKLTQGTRIAIK